MKHILAALLVLLLLPAALAETPAPLPQGEAVDIDLDGDGATERFSWEMVPGEYEERLVLTVTLGDGQVLTYETDVIADERVWLTDLDGDGAAEILATGDVMSDDYYTWCLRLVDGALYEALFPDGDRGENTEGYFKCGYGMIDAIDGNKLTLTGSQDVLGTWMGSRTVALGPVNRFEFADDGLWIRSVNLTEGVWEYGALTTTRELPYMDLGGAAAGTLAPGTQLMVLASDKRDYVWFITRDDVAGVLAISSDYDRGWGLLVDGIPENECFESIPYAD